MRRIIAVLMMAALWLAACGQAPVVVTQPAFIPNNQVPNLTLPEGATLFGGGGGGGGGDSRQQGQMAGFEFSSELPLEAIHNHFAGQLESAGWQSLSEERGEQSLTTYWEIVDETAATWAAKLVVEQQSELAPYTYRLTLDLLVP